MDAPPKEPTPPCAFCAGVQRVLRNTKLRLQAVLRRSGGGPDQGDPPEQSK